MAGVKVFNIEDPSNLNLVDTFNINPIVGELFEGAFGIFPSEKSEFTYGTDRGKGLLIFRLNEDVTAVDNLTLKTTSFKNYPNPAQELIYVDLPLSDNVSILPVAIDLKGCRFELLRSSFRNLSLEVSNLPADVYQLLISSENVQYMSTFIKMQSTH